VEKRPTPFLGQAKAALLKQVIGTLETVSGISNEVGDLLNIQPLPTPRHDSVEASPPSGMRTIVPTFKAKK